ncbi:peptidoglycan-recognition protein SD-like isoform X2 [Diachasma alloeum]|uniref:peptidoglycan-recognition protein SD-like isoform X2 n=1 Tax=Diachasma alloeum TaxID=454923 RepID=UPI000738381D|nr:peptidoglycan-recognition protein SD-like isoform X2 [Diachasma alloeum]
MAQNVTFLIGFVMAVVQEQSAPPITLPPVIDEPLRIIRRSEWGAQPPRHPALPLSVIPPPYVIISHTASEPCSTQAECSQHVRTSQTMHMEWNKWDDIAFNFLVGGDGNVYLGRGWDVQGAHTFNNNNKSIGISFIGTFNQVAPNEKQLLAAQRLLKLGVEEGKLSKDYKLLGQRQLTETLSPGNSLYKIIQTWPHWTENP